MKSVAHGQNYPGRAYPKETRKAPGNHQGANDGAPSDHTPSMPNMGAREMTMHPENSEVTYPHRATPKQEVVRDAKHDPSARARARKYNVRSENGGANPSAYPSE